MVKGHHTSVPKELKKNVKWLEDQGVKIILGRSECARHKYPPGYIKIADKVDNGFKACGYSGNGVIRMYLYCQDEELLDKIQEKFKEP